MDRRTFLTASAAGAVALAAVDAAERAHPMTTYHEGARDVPIVEHADVLVAGGGPAGLVAAVAAARAGARTRLIEANGCLGGTWTAGLLSWIPSSHFTTSEVTCPIFSGH